TLSPSAVTECALAVQPFSERDQTASPMLPSASKVHDFSAPAPGSSPSTWKPDAVFPSDFSDTVPRRNSLLSDHSKVVRASAPGPSRRPGAAQPAQLRDRRPLGPLAQKPEVPLPLDADVQGAVAGPPPFRRVRPLHDEHALLQRGVVGQEADLLAVQLDGGGR